MSVSSICLVQGSAPPDLIVSHFSHQVEVEQNCLLSVCEGSHRQSAHLNNCVQMTHQSDHYVSPIKSVCLCVHLQAWFGCMCVCLLCLCD